MNKNVMKGTGSIFVCVIVLVMLDLLQQLRYKGLELSNWQALDKFPNFTKEMLPISQTIPRLKHFMVTGGAGYIGSHATAYLLEQGHRVTVVDNLSRGSQNPIHIFSEAYPSQFTFYDINIGNTDQLDDLFSKYRYDAVWHFAAVAFTKESVEKPVLYHQNITVNTQILATAMKNHNIPELVYSSTCAVYGVPAKLPITEETPTNPSNPYGEAKLAAENILQKMSTSSFKVRILRYFNVIGAQPFGFIGENPRPELQKYSRLWTVCLDAIAGRRSGLSIRGDKFDTVDGTGVRDYVHVWDLVRAHLSVMGAPGHFSLYNVATGKPTTVKQFVDACATVSKVELEVDYTPARPYDPPILYADPAKIFRDLDWKPSYINIVDSLRTAWHYVALQKKEGGKSPHVLASTLTEAGPYPKWNEPSQVPTFYFNQSDRNRMNGCTLVEIEANGVSRIIQGTGLPHIVHLNRFQKLMKDTTKYMKAQFSSGFRIFIDTSDTSSCKDHGAAAEGSTSDNKLSTPRIFPFPITGNAFQPLALLSFPLPLHKYHQNMEKILNVVDPMEFNQKTEKAVWHGSASGYMEWTKAFDPKMTQKPRDKLIAIAAKNPSLIEASFSRKPWFNILAFKYIISVSGNSWASLLAQALWSNSVVLRQDSIMYQWFESMLIPWTHYIPVKYDLSDLISRIQWAKAHPVECNKIAQAATIFARNFFNEAAKLKYTYKTIEYNMPKLIPLLPPPVPTKTMMHDKQLRTSCTIVFANTWYQKTRIPDYPISYGWRQMLEYGNLGSGASQKQHQIKVFSAELNAKVCKNSQCNGTQIIVKYGTQFIQEADVLMYHARDPFSKPSNSKSGAVTVQYGYENAAFGGTFASKPILKWIDHLSMPHQKVSVPIYTLYPPVTSAQFTLELPVPFEQKIGFIAEVSSHCEPVRTAYVARMANHAKARGYGKVASMGKCNHNDETLVQLDKKYAGDIASQKEERRHLFVKATEKHKFSIVFLNADCDGWIDMRLENGFKARNVVVYMGTKKSILAKIWPTKLLQGMVFAEEFESPEALTDYLHILSKNKTRYENMLKWRTDGYDITTWTKGLRFEGGKEDTSCWWCDLCSLKQTANIRDADMWPVGTDFTCKKRQKEWWLSGKNPTPNGEKATPTATATKHFVYLIQSAKPHKDPSNRLVPTGDRDILYLCFMKGCDTSAVPSADVMVKEGTWTDGRNILLEMALARAEMQGSGYTYFIFLDEDQVAAIIGSDPWSRFEKWLIQTSPSVGYFSQAFPKSSGYSTKRFNIDAACNAFHRDTLGTLLPYDTSLDTQGIFFSQYIMNVATAAMFAGRRLGFEPVAFDYTLNKHTDTSKYKRSTDWRIPQKYMSTVFKDKTLQDAVSLVNCNELETTRFCDYNDCPSSQPFKHVIATPGWISEHLNPSSTFTQQRLSFLNKHALHLSKFRTKETFVPSSAKTSCDGKQITTKNNWVQNITTSVELPTSIVGGGMYLYCLCKTRSQCNSNCDADITFAESANDYDMPTSTWSSSRNGMYRLAKDRMWESKHGSAQSPNWFCFMDGDITLNAKQKVKMNERLRKETEFDKVIIPNYNNLHTNNAQYSITADGAFLCYHAKSIDSYLPMRCALDSLSDHSAQWDLFWRGNMFSPFMFKVYMDIVVYNPSHNRPAKTPSKINYRQRLASAYYSGFSKGCTWLQNGNGADKNGFHCLYKHRTIYHITFNKTHIPWHNAVLHSDGSWS